MNTSKGSLKSASRSVTDQAIYHLLHGINCPRSLAVWLLYSYNEHQQLVDLEFNDQNYRSASDARDAYVATNFLRKAKFLSLEADPAIVALTKFLQAEEQCKRTNARFRDLLQDPSFRGPNVWLLERTRHLVAQLLGERPEQVEGYSTTFDVSEWLRSCNWGPGTNFSLRGYKTAPAYKFQSQTGITSELYQCTRDLFTLAYPLWDQQLRASNPLWGAGVSAEVGDQTVVWLPEQQSSSVEEFITVNCECWPVSQYSQPKLQWELYKRRGYRSAASFEKGNRLTTVSKNAKTDRVIAVEPALNSWFQLGLGEMIRRRLLRYGGIDLHQQDRNQLLAFYGSRTGNLATVDFSSASDTISEEVVRTLLPSEWFRVLDASRSHFGLVPDLKLLTLDPRDRHENACLWRRYEKFSSMGNGFTFPLQSLIFTAAAIAVCEYSGVDSEYVGVYGDDVVLPSECFGLYQEFCAFLGFTVGPDKSFWTGFFRESCGAHYLRGVDLKPIYLEDRLDSIERLYVLANGIRRLAHRSLATLGCDRRYRRCWRFLVSQVPQDFRFFIPDGVGDGGFVGNFDEARPDAIRSPQIRFRGRKLPLTWVEGYQVRMRVQLPVTDDVFHRGLHLGRLFDVDRRNKSSSEARSPFIEDLSGGGNAVPRRRAARPVVKWVDVPKRWYDLGPWA